MLPSSCQQQQPLVVAAGAAPPSAADGDCQPAVAQPAARSPELQCDRLGGLLLPMSRVEAQA